MLNAIAREAQQISAGQNVIFSATRVRSRRCACSNGWLNHVEGSGLFTITNRGNQPMAVELQYNCNGESIGGTEMDYTVVTAGVFQNVGASTLIPIPAGSDRTVSVGNISAGTVLVKDANLIIKKLS